MRNRYWLIVAIAALAAGPVAAQNEAAEPVANETNEVTTTDANAALDANIVATPPAINAFEPAPAPTESELASNAAVDDDDDGGGFPWGVVGLVGLIGLLGRRRG